MESGERRLVARKRLERFMFERALDGAQPIGPLGVAERGNVFEAGGMGDVKSRSSYAVYFL